MSCQKRIRKRKKHPSAPKGQFFSWINQTRRDYINTFYHLTPILKRSLEITIQIFQKQIQKQIMEDKNENTNR